MKREYSVRSTPIPFWDVEALEKTLNVWGAHGWRLVHVEVDVTYHLIMEREVGEEV